MDVTNKEKGKGFRNFMSGITSGLSSNSSIAISLAETALNNIFGGIAQDRQNEINKELMAIQHRYNEKSAVEQMKRNLELYRQTQSTEAKVAELKNAGLSVGLLQGTPSQGGASGSGMANTSAMGVSPMAISPLDIANTELALAQAENIKNKTKNESEGGIEYQIKEEQKRLFENQADVEGYNADVASIDAWIKSATANQEFANKQYEFGKVMQEYLNLVEIGKQLTFTNEVNTETKQQQIDTIKNNNTLIFKQILEVKSRTTLNEEQVKLVEKKIEEIDNNIWVTDKDGNKISIAQADYDKFYDQLENTLYAAGITAGGHLVGDLMDAIITGKVKSFYPKKKPQDVRK